MVANFGAILCQIEVFQRLLGSKIYLVLVLSLAASVLEGFGFLMFLPMIVLFQQGGLDPTEDSEESDVISGAAMDFISSFDAESQLQAALSVFVICFLLKGVFIYCARGFTLVMQAELGRMTRRSLYRAFMTVNLGFFNRYDTGYFVNTINVQANGVVGTFSALNELAAKFLASAIYTLLAFSLAPIFGSFALIIGATALLGFAGINRTTQEIGMVAARESNFLSKLIVESVQGFKYLISTGQNNNAMNDFVEASLNRFTELAKRNAWIRSLIGAVQEPIGVISIVGIASVEIFYFSGSLETILVAILLFNRALNSLLGIQAGWNAVLAKWGNAERALSALHLFEENAENRSGVEVVDPPATICFRNVSFRYDADSNFFLNNVNLLFPAGKTIALIGASGSGKSTVVDLMTLVVKPCDGTIWVNESDSRSIDIHRWRKNIGFVSQDYVIFDDTIFNNVSMWTKRDSLPEAALEEKVWEALKKANLDEYVRGLPKGLDTIVGDRGVALSGGQKQRLAIARELFREPFILILDEATSSLDTDSELAIHSAITSLKGKMTIILIAHRLATIQGADMIYHLKDGEVIESGSYETLMSDSDSQLRHLVDQSNLPS